MIRRFHDTAAQMFWSAELIDDVIEIRSGKLGEEGDRKTIEDAFAEAGMPADVLLDELAAKLPPTYVEVLPDNLLEIVERGHRVSLHGRLRQFYADREYLAHEGKRAARLDCRVKLASGAVQGNFDREYYDPKAKKHVKLIPISSKVNERGYEDEQQWIGVDPTLENGPVYGLYTSGDFDVLYPTLDAFLNDLS